MTVADFLRTALVEVVGPGAVGGTVVVLVFRTYVTEKIRAQIKSEYDRQLETHRSELASQSAVEIEKLKSQLSIVAAERQVRFSKLHERRADVVAKAYELIKQLNVAMSVYVSVGQFGNTSDEERRRNAGEAYNCFSDYILINAIFLPKVTAKKLEELRQTYASNFMDFRLGVEMTTDAKQRTEKWLKISDTVEKLTSTAIAELEEELRQLIGDEPSAR